MKTRMMDDIVARLVVLSINEGFGVEGEGEAYRYEMTRLLAVNPSAIRPLVLVDADKSWRCMRKVHVKCAGFLS